MIELEVEGLDEIANLLEKYNELSSELLQSLLYEEAINILGEAIQQTPVDTGNLRASAHIEDPVISGNDYSITIGFGGPAGSGNLEGATNTEDVSYAWVVHENPRNFFHIIGKDHYLIDPALEAMNTLAERWAADIKVELERCHS